MKRIAIAGIAMLVLSGCRAPMPSFDLLAPYGTSRVPPPGTGTIGTGGTYYTPPSGQTTSPPPVGTGFRLAPPGRTINKWSNLGEPTESKVAADVEWAPTRSLTSQASVVDLDVALAKQQPTSRVIAASQLTEHRGPIRIVQPSSVSGNPTALRGLPVIGTGVSRAPRSFVPSGRVVDITELPDVSSGRTVPAPTRAATKSRSSATVASDGWRSRT
ncbi:MAG: hypothetical protein CMJ64_24605 [Planctomycetaceae bacterium]|nr:hypothetical protein [Planctomycetaceae bacterium]